jgi:hypothetical protein
MLERARFAGLEPERVKLLIESLAQIRERL